MTNIVIESSTFVQAHILNLTCDTMNVIELFTLYTTHASVYKQALWFKGTKQFFD